MALWRGLECGSKAAATKLNKATKRIKIKYARRNETPRGGVERFARERHSHRGMAFAYFAFYKRYGRKFKGHFAVLHASARARDHMLRHGINSSRRKQRILLRQIRAIFSPFKRKISTHLRG